MITENPIVHALIYFILSLIAWKMLRIFWAFGQDELRGFICKTGHRQFKDNFEYNSRRINEMSDRLYKTENCLRELAVRPAVNLEQLERVAAPLKSVAGKKVK